MAIKSEHSWIKHHFAAKPIWGQACAYRARFPDHRMLLIDGNAGDGIGVEKLQQDFFMPALSHPTPEILTNLAADVGNADVVLCEQDRTRRVELWRRFPQACILDNQRDIMRQIKPEHQYALWVSDPCGPRGHGLEYMVKLSQHQRLLTDFVVIMNEIAVRRIAGTSSDYAGLPLSRQLYGGMERPQWWLEQLNKRWLARSIVFKQSSAFHHRIMIISNYLADASKRHPFTEIVGNG